MAWFLFLVGVVALSCSIFLWRISIDLEEHHIEDIDSSLPTLLLLRQVVGQM